MELCRDCKNLPISTCLLRPFSSRQFHRAVVAAFKGRKCQGPLKTENERGAGEKRQLSGRSILLVEDNLMNQQLAKIILEQAGHTVLTADNGLNALEWLQRGEPVDLIFMDVQMPEMDGLTTTRIIRSCESGAPAGNDIDESRFCELQVQVAGKHIPIIAMTANAMSGDREQCIAAGMDDYITKPFVPEEISAMITKFSNLQK